MLSTWKGIQWVVTFNFVNIVDVVFMFKVTNRLKAKVFTKDYQPHSNQYLKIILSWIKLLPQLTRSRELKELLFNCMYEDLQDLLELTPKKDVLFLIGDWNAKVGIQEILGITGKFGLGFHITPISNPPLCTPAGSLFFKLVCFTLPRTLALALFSPGSFLPAISTPCFSLSYLPLVLSNITFFQWSFIYYAFRMRIFPALLI